MYAGVMLTPGHWRLCSLTGFSSPLELNNIPQLGASDPDTNMPSRVNFDYYSVIGFCNCSHIQNSYQLKSFSVLNCNIRSLNANFDHLTQTLADLSFPFTLIGLTETWINNYTDQGIVHHLPGYTFISQPTSLRAGGGGLEHLFVMI